MISRNLMAEELILRENLNKAIKLVKKKVLIKGIKKINEDLDLRKVVQDLIIEAATSEPDKTPHASTGINVLEKLLKNIIPTVEDDFKTITTDSEQRQSYRAHIINAIKNTLAPVTVNDDAVIDVNEAEGDVDINIQDDKFIDINADSKQKQEPEDPKEEFGTGVDGFDGDHTGRDIAYETFQSIENQIVDAYSKLGNEDDQEKFYDYLITNFKLYLDKFEDELAPAGSLEEPTTPEYEQEKSALDQDMEPPAPEMDELPPEDPIV